MKNLAQHYSEAAVHRFSSKWRFYLFIWFFLGFFCNIHRKTPVSESVFNKVADLKACNLIEKRLQYRCFPVNIEKFLRAASLKNTSGSFIVSICYFKFQINKRILLIEIIKFSSSRNKFIII